MQERRQQHPGVVLEVLSQSDFEYRDQFSNRPTRYFLLRRPELVEGLFKTRFVPPEQREQSLNSFLNTAAWQDLPYRPVLMHTYDPEVANDPEFFAPLAQSAVVQLAQGLPGQLLAGWAQLASIHVR